MGKAKALRLGIQKGLQHTASLVLPKSFHCPVCKFQFNAYDVALQSKTEGISAEEIVAGHVIQCIGSLKGQAQCPDCGQMIKGKDFKEHMDKNHPIKDDHQDCECE